MDMCTDRRIGMRIDMCIDMYIDMYIDMCVDMRIDMCVDMCVDSRRQVCRYVFGVCHGTVGKLSSRPVTTTTATSVPRAARLDEPSAMPC